MELTYEIVTYLQNKGFKVEFLDDLSGWWLVKPMKTKYFGNVDITVDEFRGKTYINVQRDGIGDIDDETVDFIRIDYSKKNLKKIIKLLKGK